METIRITGAGSHLQGVGRLRDGRAAFVPFSIPGEVVDVEIVRDCGRYVEARLLAVRESSPARVEADCPAFGRCGGCQARHMAYEETLRLKRQRVADALERIGGLKDANVLDTLPMPEPLRCRNKAEYAVSGNNIGFLRAGSREVVPVEDCLLQREESVRALRQLSREQLRGLRGAVTRVNRREEVMLTLCGDAPRSPIRTFPGVASLYYCRLKPRPAHALDGACNLLDGAERLEETLCGLRFSLLPQSFFQVNAAQAERMYAIALDALALRPGDAALDAYCGAGTITLLMAARGANATGVEIVRPAVLDAIASAKRNGLDARFLLGDAAEEIPRLVAAGERFAAAVLDPPRRGADARVLQALISAAPQRIVYISCDPATLARDLKTLATGGYQLEFAQPVDMFAYTGHVETVVLLSKLNTKQHIEVELNLDDLDLTVAESKATYEKIKAYVLEHTGLKVSSLYIAQVEQKRGIVERENHNKAKSEDAKQPQCPPEKEKAILEELRHFRMIP